jgi:hypothetical protein
VDGGELRLVARILVSVGDGLTGDAGRKEVRQRRADVFGFDEEGVVAVVRLGDVWVTPTSASPSP